jgi:hypothetical protein
LGKKILYFIVGAFIYLAFYTSCANMGMPSGGAKDSIPPVIIKSIPEMNETNFSDTKIRIYFDEFIIHEGLNEKFTISPPLKERTIFKTKGKSLIVDLKEELAENTTYSLDFKDAIIDNNEKNPYENLRIAFSTGSYIDSLRIVGFVKNAFTLEPVPQAYILLYKSPSDTLVYTTRPDFIGKTDENGLFVITNLPAETYQIFALTDNNRDLMFEPGAEPIAFLDSMLTPSAIFSPDRDTTLRESDTLVVLGKTRFFPDPIYLLQFEEDFFGLRLDDYQRPDRKYIDISFTESVEDTFSIELLNYETENEWFIMESTSDMDSLRVWLKDSLIYKKDTLQFRLSYLQQDSMKVNYTKNDTIKLYYSDGKKSSKNRRKAAKKVKKKPVSMDLKHNASQTGFDIYKKITIEVPEPVATIDTSMFHLMIQKDTLFVPIDFAFGNDSNNIRKFNISHKWEFEATYQLKIDSAAIFSIYDLPSKTLETKFTIQSEDYYGKIIFDIQNVTGPTILQLLKDNETEDVLRSERIYEDQIVEFPYLKSQKYMVKVIFDSNDNGEWDTGNLIKNIKPEEVLYYEKVIKVRKNWEQKPIWKLPTIKIFDKKVIDEEAEKERLEKLKKAKTSGSSRSKRF